MGSAGIAFFLLLSTLLMFLPIHIFIPVFLVEFIFFYSAPAYIIYWCLKEDEGLDEEAERDKFYAVRDRLVERAIKENQAEWKEIEEARKRAAGE